MRLAFFGTPEFAVPSLRALVEAGHEVLLVVAQPDRPAGRGQKLVSPPTVRFAREHGVAVAQPTKLKSGPFPDDLAALRLDVAVVAAYGRILPRAMLEAPRWGCVNVHASLLPRWRGAAPIHAAVLAGDAETGVTTMQMAEGLDTGDILLREATPIGAEETAGELHDRLAEIGARLVVRTLAERPTPVAQDDAAATWAPMLSRELSPIDWTASAAEVHRRVRGLSPWPGTTAVFRGQPLKVLRVVRAEGGGAPGELLDGARVACGEGAVELREVQLPGGRAVRGVDFVNGQHVRPGERLG